MDHTTRRTNNMLQNYRQHFQLYLKLINNNNRCSKFLIQIAKIVQQYRIAYTINTNTIGGLINKICQVVVDKNIMDTKQLLKISKLQEICYNIRKFQLQQQISDVQENCNQIKKVKQCEKQLCSQLMHLLVHYSSGRHITKMSMLFAVFISGSMLRKQVINFTLLGLILGYESIPSNQEVFMIKQSLKIAYIKLKGQYENNSFILIAYILYMSKIPTEQTMQILYQLIKCPYKIASIILKFRYQYSSPQNQNNILQCDRKLSTLSVGIIDNLVLKALLTIFSDPKQKVLHEIIFIILKKFIRYDLSILIVKNMIKKLQIGDINCLQSQWSQIFSLFEHVLNSPIFNHESVLMSKKQSFITLALCSQTKQIRFKFRSYRLQNQLVLCKLKEQSHETYQKDKKIKNNQKNSYRQIWLTVRYLQMEQFLISMLTIQNKSVIHIDKIICKLNIFQDNQVAIQITPKNTKITIDNLNQSNQHQYTFNILSISASTIIIGDDLDQIGSFPCEISQFIITEKMNRFDVIQHFRKNPQNLQQKGKFVELTIKNSLIHLLKIMGDLELIMLVASHLIRKVQDEDSLTLMLKKVMDFLGALAAVKGVLGVELPDQQKEKRISNVSCLSWLACKNRKKAKPVIQLLRFLGIRNNSKVSDNLEVLCNFVLFKDMKYQNFKIILQKIEKQLLGSLSTSNYDKYQKYEHTIIYCQRMILDLIAFCKNTQFMAEHLQQDSSRKHSYVLKIVYDHIIKAPKQLIILNFILFLLKIQYVLIDRRKQNDYVDTTMGFQIANLALKLSCFLFKKYSALNRQSFKESKQKTSVEQIISIKSEQISMWIKQILYCLDNQILYDDEAMIKYIDWQFNEVNEIECVFQKKSQTQLVAICEKIQIYLLSFNLQEIKRLSVHSFSEGQINYFWEVNLLEVDFQGDKSLLENLKYLFNFGPNQSKIRSSKVIKGILQKSFDFMQNQANTRLSHKFPRQFIQSFKITNVKQYITLLKQIFSQKIEKHQKNQKIKTAMGENLLYLLCVLPEIQYSNTKQLRYQIQKIPRIQKVLQLVQTHLVIKQFSSEIQSNENSSNISDLSNKQLFSSITVQTYIQNNPDQQNNQTLNKVLKTKKKKYNKQNYLDISILKKSLEQISLLANPPEIQKLYKIEGNSEADITQIKVKTQNFNININRIITSLDSSETDLDKQRSIIKNQIFFLKEHVYKFSCMIIDLYVFEQIKLEIIKPRCRKKSAALNRGQQLREQSEKILRQYFLDRRKNIFKIQKMWSEVEKNNKYFWELFFVQESKHQSLDISCNNLKMRSLIKIDNQKRQIQLPKAIVQASIKYSISASSDKDLTNQGESEGSIFSDSCLQELQSSQQSKDRVLEKNSDRKKVIKIKKVNQFSVLWVTTTVIYQGILKTSKNSMQFEQQEPDQFFYDLICANEQQRRTKLQIQKKIYKFQIPINKTTTMIPKRYLNHEAAAQIYSDSKSYLLCFRRLKNRFMFLKTYENLKGVLISEDKIPHLVKVYMKKWQNGDISNFTYLMHLNDLGSRSFNDMSQYYIFPWTVTNFKSKKVNQQFLNNPNNFRDLSKPVGALNQQRLHGILQNYEQSLKYEQTPSHLYGSFYSNPAIVCNYLVRLQPFSFHHYVLQKNQFDLADRIFFSFQSQYQSCTTNTGDYKQLIPQFYFFPEFLRNRSKYDFGYRQNKQLVHNVELPAWSQGQGPVQQKFIFQMRKVLESQIVTNQLHKWIDLIFGIYNQKDRAIQKNNLFVGTIYKDELKQQKKDKQLCLLLFKQFGQVPRLLFEQQHEAVHLTNRQYKIYEYKPISLSLKSPIFLMSMPEIHVKQSQIVWFNEKLEINIGMFNSSSDKLTLTYNASVFQQEKSPKDTLIKNLRYLNCQNSQTKQVNLYIYLKSGRIIFRQNNFNHLKRRSQLKQQQPIPLQTVANCHILQIHQQYNTIIIVEGLFILFYKYRIQARSQGILTSKKNSLILSKFSQFTQHRSQIKFLRICYEYGILLSLDSNHKIYVLKLHRNQVSVSQSFKLKKLGFCQSIKQMKVHEMGYIIILTTQNLIHVYNFMGDYIARLDLQKVHLTTHLNTMSSINISQNKQSQIITCFQIWNNQSSQLAIGTNFGNIYIVDFIANDEYDLMVVSDYQIKYLNVNRIGRHWQCIIADERGFKKIETDKYHEAVKRN